jgi:hypothetical protein
VPSSLFRSILKIGDEVISFLGLLDTGEGHLGTRDVFFRILEVVELFTVNYCVA